MIFEYEPSVGVEERTFHGHDRTIRQEVCGVEMDTHTTIGSASIWLCLEPVPCPIHSPHTGRPNG